LDVSVILPCYRSAAVAVVSVKRLSEYLEASTLSWQIIVVDDGGRDFGNWTVKDSRITLLSHSTNRGKGAAVRSGLQYAAGDVRIFTDVDLPYGLTPIAYAVDAILVHGCHLLLGDRQLPSSRFATPRTLGRRITSHLSAVLVRTLITGGFGDTQCGFKAIRGDIAAAILPALTIEGYAFDIELVHLCLTLGLDLRRTPVRQETDSPSSVRPLRDSLIALRDIARIVSRRKQTNSLTAVMAPLLSAEYDVRVAQSVDKWAFPIHSAVQSPRRTPRPGFP
jgi:dolichyl-phosphate beta-glucosyltransferase